MATAAETNSLECTEIIMEDGARVYLRRASTHPSVRYVLSHGNGLAIAGYEHFWAHLLGDAELLLFDLRNHGINPTAPPVERSNWKSFVSDMDRVLSVIRERYGEKKTYGVFHSMSALTCLIHSSRNPHPWRGLMLFEPPAVPPRGRPERKDHLAFHRELAERTRKRRSVFDTPAELASSMRRLLRFQRMPDSTLLQLARATLTRDLETSAYRLSCPPDFEADTFSLWNIEESWGWPGRVDCPVRIVASDPNDSDTPILSRVSRVLAADFGFEYVQVTNAGHLLQLDKAEHCASLVRQFVTALEQ